MPETLIPTNARCWTCNYALRGLTTNRCPECGRDFDPAGSTSMNLGRTPGVVGRFLLRRSGWWPIGILIVAAALVISATRWPTGGVMWTSLDLLYYFHSFHLRPRLLSYTDWAYTVGLLAAAAVILAWLIKLPLREIARRVYRQPIPPPVNIGRRIMLGTIAIFAMGGSVAIGWPYRVARAWVKIIMAPNPSGIGHSSDPPVVLSTEQYLPVLRAAVIQLPSSAERMNGLKILIEGHSKDALEVLLEAVAKETDPHIRATEILLIGLYRDKAAFQTILEFWDDPQSEIRAAVVDAVGLQRKSVVLDDFYEQPAINTNPKISLFGLVFGRRTREITAPPLTLPNDTETPADTGVLTDSLRPKIRQRMLRGETALERAAAARATLTWQQPYRLRVAEWGVWISDGGKLLLLKSIIEEIPPFVHRIGDRLASLKDQVSEIMFTTKPVLHFTVDQAMAVDVQVRIEAGRPWFAFPLPDDFALTVATVYAKNLMNGPGSMPPPVPEKFDPKGMPSLENPHTGYPWMEPAHPRIGPTGAGGFAPSENQITSLGLRWQSVIVSPERLPWMQPPEVPSDQTFQWWNRLREVPCAWVSNRDESERYLYYDGPTASHSPVTTKLDGRMLSNQDFANDLPSAGEEASFHPISSHAENRLRRRGFYIRIEASGAIPEGCVIDVPGTTDLSTQPMLHGDALIQRFHTLLTDAGLTDAEAAGLVDCWRPQFFQTPGSRFVLLMAAQDYDRLCPIRIDPPPTELVRVGLVLTEFGVVD